MLMSGEVIKCVRDLFMRRGGVRKEVVDTAWGKGEGG